MSVGQPPSHPHASPIATVRLSGLRGEAVEGLLVSLSSLPAELLEDQAAGVDAIADALSLCEAWGAHLVGLGAVAAIIGGQGKAAQRLTDLPITTGNASTAWAAVETIRRVQSLLPERRKITLFGPPGPVANAILERLVLTGELVRVAHDAPPRRLTKQIDELNLVGYGSAELVDTALIGECADDILVAASSTGGRLKLSELSPGTIAVDVAEPLDIMYDCPRRDDVCVLDGEYVRLPTPLKGDIWRTVYGLVTGQRRHVFACFAEPMMLSLANCQGLASVGRDVAADSVYRIGQIAAEQGFWVSDLYERGVPVESSRLTKLFKV